MLPGGSHNLTSGLVIVKLQVRLQSSFASMFQDAFQRLGTGGRVRVGKMATAFQTEGATCAEVQRHVRGVECVRMVGGRLKMWVERVGVQSLKGLGRYRGT